MKKPYIPAAFVLPLGYKVYRDDSEEWSSEANSEWFHTRELYEFTPTHFFVDLTFMEPMLEEEV